MTLAFLLAPFLAATAVAAQSSPASPTKQKIVSVTWLAVTKSSVQKAIDVIADAAESVAPPAEKVPAPALRAQAPPPPPPPSNIADPATWIWPADGPITSPFGRRWGRAHEGVDIDAPYGGAVVAPQRGTVILAGWGMSGYGRVVHIDHGNGIVSSFSHLSAITVVAGQVVAQGQQVGAVGASGSVTAAHLHYEVRIGGVARNPVTWLHPGGASAAGNPG
ncbi:MAG TPA: M23 family metallopeptidase [Acidimicrobiales bacterium]|nr:M23 family metallopeptidase [Acidimicrobiales bacterium]